jgi:type IV pilus assembly protein PilF
MAVLTVLRASAIAVLLAFAAGCVSSSTLPQPPQSSKKEAARYNLELGVSYLRQGDLKTAQAKLEKAIADDDSLATAYSALGLVFERLGDKPGAEKNYRRAVSMAPEDPDALNALAVFLCLQKQETAEAMRGFDKALAIPLSRADANRAMLYTNAGLCAKRFDLALAEDYLRKALAADPGYKGALLQLADVSFGRSNYLQSRAFLERFLAASPATPDALWLGVRIERALGGAAAARGYADRLKREFPESSETRLLLESERNAG